MLYDSKKLDTTLAIISLNAYFYDIQKTINSSAFLTYECKKIAIIPFETQLEQSIDCQVLNGGYCITSMLDSAIKNAETEWILVVFAGANLQKGLDIKYSRYINTYKDVLFPVANRIWNFPEGSMNGIFINKNFHKEVGDFGKGNDLQITKLIWAAKAIEKGGKFKAIVGVKNL